MDLDELLDDSELPDVSVDVDRAWQRVRDEGSGRRRKRVVGVGVLMVVVLGGAAVATTALVNRDQPLGVTSDSGPGESQPRDSWAPMADSPLSPRVPAAAVWTGEEMIVVGGSDAPQCGSGADCTVQVQPLADGAAYDPASDSWRTIADAPLAFASASATWTGTEVLVAVSSLPVSDDVRTLLSYDPVQDVWSERADPPPSLARSAWTGSEWVFVSGTSSGEASDSKYLPESDRWVALPSAGLEGRGSDRQVVWTGEELVLFASTFDEEGQPTNGFYRALVLDDDQQTWRLLPLPRIANNGNRWIAAGDFVVNPTGGSTGPGNGPANDFDYGGILDLRTEEWKPLGDRPFISDPNPFSRTGYIGEADGWVVDDSFLFDPASGRWHEIRPRPDDVNPGIAVWTGREILTWGGFSESDDRSTAPQLSADGFAYRPPQRSAQTSATATSSVEDRQEASTTTTNAAETGCVPLDGTELVVGDHVLTAVPAGFEPVGDVDVSQVRTVDDGGEMHAVQRFEDPAGRWIEFDSFGIGSPAAYVEELRDGAGKREDRTYTRCEDLTTGSARVEYSIGVAYHSDRTVAAAQEWEYGGFSITGGPEFGVDEVDELLVLAAGLRARSG